MIRELESSTPTLTCPECGASMLRRVARNGPRAGSSFWGCSTFPRCRAIVDVEPVGSGAAPARQSENGSSAKPLFRQRVTWTESARRPAWSTFYSPAGGRLRSWDAVGQIGPAYAQALSPAAFYLTTTNEKTGATEEVRTCVDVLRRILTRGDRPPVDPLLEGWVLRRVGLQESVEASSDPGDASVRLKPGAIHPNSATLASAVTHREPFALDANAVLADGRPLLSSPLEVEFMNAVVPTTYGDAAGHWFHPQAHMGALTGASDDHRRVDFLVHHPAIQPHIVELDGAQHQRQVEVDRDRDQALAAAGIACNRVASRDLGDGRPAGLDALRGASERPAAEALALVWGPVVGQRIARALVEAIAEGWLTGDQWRLRIQEPIGIAGIAVQSALELISAVGDIWNAPVSPQRVTLASDDGLIGFVLSAPGRYLAANAPVPEQFDVDITIEPFAGPWHQLPAPEGRRIVVRSAPLPVLLREGRLEGGERRSVPDVERVDRGTLERLLSCLFAKREFYPAHSEHPRGQEVALRRVLAGKDTAVLLPTGAGKSLIYQFASLLLPGRTLVIDPIVALIDDQLDGLAAQGIDRAIGITRSDNIDRVVDAKLAAVRQGDALFCFIAPERLQQRKFRDAVRALAVASPINLCVVDEAHCVSEWGHDFRTSYLDIGRVLREVAADVTGTPPSILALTGTASRSVLRDMLIELDIDRSDPEAIVSPQDFDRPELTFSVVNAREDEAVTRLLGTLRSLPAQFGVPEPQFFRANGQDTLSGIVFTQTVNPARNRPDLGLTNLQALLRAEFDASVGIYAGAQPRDWKGDDWEAAKRRMAADFKSNQLPVLVATKAYGMGIDKANVRYIVHAGVSGSLEAYYQEAGRAGRDRQRSHCIIVHDPFDRGFWDWAHGKAFGGIEADLTHVAQMLELIGELGVRRTVFVPMSGSEERQDDEERAIHRLKLLGVVRDYLMDWGGRAYELLLSDIDAPGVDRALLQYVRRSQPARVKAYERELTRDQAVELRDRVLANAERLIGFIYETVVNSRRRALDEMVRLADEAKSDDDIRERILAYLELGQVARELEPLVDAPEFSFEPWQSLFHGIQSVDDAREWRGATARFLESSPDHPGLLIGRALAEVVAPDGGTATFSYNILAGLQSATSTYLVAREDAVGFVEWLLLWLHEHRGRWVPLGFLVAERFLGTAHLDELANVETEILRDRTTANADELALVLSRRIERVAGALNDLQNRARELTA